jgi:hypothetical protein
MRNAGRKLFHIDFSHLSGVYLDVANSGDISYWAKELNCEESDLVKAISMMGNHVALINDWLIMNRLRKEFIYN